MSAGPATSRLKRLFSKGTGAGVRRWTFVPDPPYRKELAANANPNEVGGPPCGERGTSPDGIQDLETFSDDPARRVLFVRVGQDEPLFNENSLRLLPPPGAPPTSKPASR